MDDYVIALVILRDNPLTLFLLFFSWPAIKPQQQHCFRAAIAQRSQRHA